MNTQSGMLVQLDHVSKRYGGRWALQDVSLGVPRGQVIGLVGPNGSGKSTLLRLMAGLIYPSQGRVIVNGVQAERRMARHVAYLSESDVLYPFFTVTETVQFHSEQFSDVDSNKAEELLAFMQLSASHRVEALSRGDRERLKLVLVLARRAALVLMDEPLAFLDPLLRQTLIESVLSYVDLGTQTVVIATHQVAEAELVLDQVVLLAEGRVLAVRDVERIREERGQSLVTWMRGQLAAQARNM